MSKDDPSPVPGWTCDQHADQYWKLPAIRVKGIGLFIAQVLHQLQVELRQCVATWEWSDPEVEGESSEGHITFFPAVELNDGTGHVAVSFAWSQESLKKMKPKKPFPIHARLRAK